MHRLVPYLATVILLQYILIHVTTAAWLILTFLKSCHTEFLSVYQHSIPWTECKGFPSVCTPTPSTDVAICFLIEYSSDLGEMEFQRSFDAWLEWMQHPHGFTRHLYLWTLLISFVKVLSCPLTVSPFSIYSGANFLSYVYPEETVFHSIDCLFTGLTSSIAG